MPPERLWNREFVLVFCANFLQSVGFNLYLNLPGYLRDLGASEVLIGFIFSLTAVAAIAARPLIGRAMDQQGRRFVFLLGGLLNTAVCAAYITVDGIGPWVALVRVGHGLSEAMLFSALFTYAADLIPPSRRTEGIALFGISGLLPIAVGATTGELIEQALSYQEVFSLSVLLAAVSFLLCLPLRDAHHVHASEEPPRGFGAALKQPDLLPLWVVSTVFATALASAFTFMKTFVETSGIGSMTGFFTAYSVSGVLLRMLFARVPDRIGPKRTLFPAMTLIMVGFILLAVAETDSAVIWGGVFCGLGHGFTFPILMGLVVARARGAERGAAMSIFTAVFDAGMLIGGPSFGLLIGGMDYPVAFAVAALLLLVGAVSFALWDRGR